MAFSKLHLFEILLNYDSFYISYILYLSQLQPWPTTTGELFCPIRRLLKIVICFMNISYCHSYLQSNKRCGQSSGHAWWSCGWPKLVCRECRGSISSQSVQHKCIQQCAACLEDHDQRRQKRGRDFSTKQKLRKDNHLDKLDSFCWVWYYMILL